MSGLTDNGERELKIGLRLLKSAEIEHLNGSKDATNWYLRSIAHLLSALCQKVEPQ